MRAAISLGHRGQGISHPNPNVGAIIVKDNIIIGRGYTMAGGRPHAEAMALAQAGEAAKGATLYSTLEPCTHESPRGPNCCSLIINSGIKRLICGAVDPDYRMRGKGLERLSQHDIEIISPILEDESRASMAGFLSQQEKGRPFITLKLAMSIDGAIARDNGQSKWITGDAARRHVHALRARHDAILIGAGTFRADAPALDVRLMGLHDRAPRKIIMGKNAPDGWGHICAPNDVNLLPDNWLLLEGGGECAASFLQNDLVDRIMIYRAPIIMGSRQLSIGDMGLSDLADAHGRWRMAGQYMLGNDRLEIYDRMAEHLV
ncbi:riboflavin biosynthesis protein RibD [Sphingorhabdus lutea]|uniref:Riboflavin biosynthesis protein RibD n=2 Tax=Sphingorhabdus lutea TaxID=1913578 RepID=A0A1L3JEI9_9SPHN|nr:riboflavin biosynthesis protein RibD [Sphingorhabdus lutea]